MINKIRILFIIPSFRLGGTTSSLVGLLNSDLSSLYEIGIFSIINAGFALPPLSNYSIGMNNLTTAFYGNYSFMNIKDKISYLWIKVFKQNPKFAKKIESWIIDKTITRIEKKKRYDIVVGFQEDTVTRFSSRFNHSFKIAWIHSDYSNTFGKEPKDAALYSLFTKIVCVSEFTRKSFLNIYPMFSERTMAIHNLFDYNSILAKSQEGIKDSQYDTSTYTIVSLGRICDVKRFYVIPQIAEKLIRKGLIFRWYIIGSAVRPTDRDLIYDAIERYGVGQEVICLGGKTNPYPYLKASDLLVSLSKSEACPMIFNEAKVLNVPIISTDFGSAFEFIEQGVDGYICTLEEMPDKIFKFATNPKQLRMVKDNNRFQVSNTYILSQLKELFSL